MKKQITILMMAASIGAFAQSSQNATQTPRTATKRVLIEEATGTWCGWCVRGICMLADLESKYNSTTALVAVHNDDPMVNSTYDSGMGNIGSGYPRGVVDRQKSVDPADFETEYTKRITYNPPVDVFIDNVSWDPAKRLISFKVNATAVTALSGSYKFNASITEMKVSGTSSGYDQHNYYAGGKSGVMCGFETKPGTIKATDIAYDFVGRAILGGWAGTSGSIPSSVSVGTTVSYTYTYTVPATYKEKDLTLIGFVLNSSGKVENCSKVVNILTSVTEPFKTELVAYPNPTTDFVYVRNSDPLNIIVYNTVGEVVQVEKHAMQINLSNLDNGLYFLKFDNGQSSITKKFLVNK